MAAALLRRQGHAFGVILLLACFEIVFRVGAGARRERGVGTRDDDGLRELGELALTRDHAVKLAVRRKKTDRVGADDVSSEGDEAFAGSERRAVTQGAFEVVATTDIVEPVDQHPRQFATRGLYLRQQGVERRLGWHVL